MVFLMIAVLLCELVSSLIFIDLKFKPFFSRTDTCALKNSPRVKAIVDIFSAAWNIWQASKGLFSHGRRLSQHAARLQFHLKPQLLVFLLLFLVSVVVFVVSRAL